MSDDQSRPAENEDPLTAPVWKIDEDIAPTIGEVVEEVLEVPIVSRNIPTPPDVDQILRGEYTGWVPLIKPGDSLETATNRFELDNQRRAQGADSDFDDIFEKVSSSVDENDLSEIKELIREIKAEPDVYVKDFYPTLSEIAEDPDTVVSPSQALEEARRRIEQMRANLQVNLSRVAQSFEHPIFEPRQSSFEEPQEVVIVEATISEPVVEEIIETSPVAQELPVEEPIRFEMPVTEEFKTKPVVFDYVPVEEPASETKQTSATSKVVSDESVTSEHSLELVIMRDEIKDLRDRLDTSQKLIESLMERLANLAELALTSRNRD
jgi:hypothetical protein